MNDRSRNTMSSTDLNMSKLRNSIVSRRKYSFVRSYCVSALDRDLLRSPRDILEGSGTLPDTDFFSTKGESDSISVSSSVSRSVDVAVSPSVAVGVGGMSLSGSKGDELGSRDKDAVFGKASIEEDKEADPVRRVEDCKGVRCAISLRCPYMRSISDELVKNDTNQQGQGGIRGFSKNTRNANWAAWAARLMNSTG